MFTIRSLLPPCGSIAGLVLAGSLACPAGQLAAQDVASYELTFRSTWSPETHPIDFPSNAHYSRLVGATHNSDVEFWNAGGLASPGIESMAETGGVTALQAEMDQAIVAGAADQQLLGLPLGRSPAELTFDFETSADFPLITLVTMLAPSPDWFAGTHGLNLRPNGEWLPYFEYPLTLYDAGTDSGPNYRSADFDTNPQQPIQIANEGPFAESSTIGSFVFLRLLAGDLTRDGLRTTEDLDALAVAIRDMTTDVQYDVNSDGIVSFDDRVYWIEQLANSYMGDANLDGEFNSSDLVTIFQSGEYEDPLAGNSTWAEGDFDGDGDFGTSDLILAFASGAFEAGPRSAVAVVPEPAAIGLATVGAAIVLVRTRRAGPMRHVS